MPKQPDLREYIHESGFRKGWVAEQIGATQYSFARNICLCGRITVDQRKRLAEVLAISMEELDLLLAETSRRYNAKQASENKSGPAQHGINSIAS